LSYAPVSGLSFSPGDPPIVSRVAGDRFMLQPGSCCRNHLISCLQTTPSNITQEITAAPTAAIEVVVQFENCFFDASIGRARNLLA
jgi:hypothetical protein